jgi:hypothetical protein
MAQSEANTSLRLVLNESDKSFNSSFSFNAQ